jgi:hypothetical protein
VQRFSFTISFHPALFNSRKGRPPW